MADLQLTNVRLNIPGLIEIANDANEALCKPIAEQVAARARASAPRDTGDYAESIHTETDPRTGQNDWAHTYVVADDKKALIIEARTGNLARALEG